MVPPLRTGTSHGTMTHCQQTVLAIGFALEEQELVIPNMPMPKVLNTVIRTLQYSFTPVHSTAFSARTGTLKKKTLKPVSDVDGKTSCICYFGGDPTPQLPFAIRASRLALEKNRDRILRICWETNGSMDNALLDEIVELSIISGGCVKFDLKAWDENLHKVLTGITNKRTLENFARAAEKINVRRIPPILIASTLLVPGYIDEDEVKSIARFIASIDPDIPYTLLAFYPHFYMSDMPLTKKFLAERCLMVAREEGLKNVKVGNIHLLR